MTNQLKILWGKEWCLLRLLPAVVAASLILASRGYSATAASTTSGETTITWTWSEDRQIGQFANGEWWVVGPITLTSITPADPYPGDSTDINGTMVNLKIGLQGWSNRFPSATKTYAPDLNIARRLPYQVGPTSSIITLQDLEGTARGFESGAVLTVVDAPVVAGTFRPPTYSEVKPAQWRTWTVDSLKYDGFQRLTPTPNAPNPTSESIRSQINYLFIDIWQGGAQTNTDLKITGKGGGPGYGREVAGGGVDAVLALNCDYTASQKKNLMVSVAQRGIDVYGSVVAGYSANQEGGHNHGRKIFLMAAAVALDDKDMVDKLDSVAYPSHLEDKHFIFINQERIDTPHWTGEADYTQEMLNMPDWGDGLRAARSSPDFTYTGYRQIVSSPTVGFVLCASVMGMRKAINNEAMFEYIIERYFPIMDGKPEGLGWPRVPNDDSTSLPGLNTTNGIRRGVYEIWVKNRPGMTTWPESATRLTIPLD